MIKLQQSGTGIGFKIPERMIQIEEKMAVFHVAIYRFCPDNYRE
jgi:hypothetical protein